MSCLLALSLSLHLFHLKCKKNLYEKYIYQFWLDTKLAQPLFFCQNLELYILHEMHTGYQFHHLRIAWGPTPTLIWDKFEPMLLKNCKDTLWINSWLLTIGSNLTHARSTPPPFLLFWNRHIFHIQINVCFSFTMCSVCVRWNSVKIIQDMRHSALPRGLRFLSLANLVFYYFFSFFLACPDAEVGLSPFPL